MKNPRGWYNDFYTARSMVSFLAVLDERVVKIKLNRQYN